MPKKRRGKRIVYIFCTNRKKRVDKEDIGCYTHIRCWGRHTKVSQDGDKCREPIKQIWESAVVWKRDCICEKTTKKLEKKMLTNRKACGNLTKLSRKRQKNTKWSLTNKQQCNLENSLRVSSINTADLKKDSRNWERKRCKSLNQKQ